jgi:hypothetical protein
MVNLEKRVEQLEFSLGVRRRHGPDSGIGYLSDDELWEIVFPGTDPAVCEQVNRDHPRLILAILLRAAVSAFRAQMGGHALTAEQRADIEKAVTSDNHDTQYFALAFQAQADGHELTADQRACIKECETIYQEVDRITKPKKSSIPKVSPFVSIA